MARLIVTRGPNVGDSYVLSKRIVTIGRDEGCAIRLDREGRSSIGFATPEGAGNEGP